MKHVFIINPAAGKEDSVQALKSLLEGREDCEIYATEGPCDATEYIRRRCSEHPSERVRFYACGGDGTLNEVANGVVGFENASMGCYPCGSGNDFVKYFGGKKVFRNIDALLEAPEEYIDLMRVGDRYAINATHFGFDSAVATTMRDVRRKKIIGGSNAYTTGVVVALFKAMKNKCSVTADGELLNPDGELLLCTIANGQYVGGSFRCAPRSLCNDGLLEVCLVRPVSRVTFMKLIKSYGAGLHLEDKKFEKYIVYRRAKSLEIEAPEGFIYSFDGELIENDHFTVEVAPRAVRFAVPKNAVFLPGALHISSYEKETEPATL
ncbi:MAG: YegS/Rv2252/BmrU family lipid kinase [Ruminococcaceae bacterium]|nr:YegS/Rv2252/BmrU family lipid kinase [Oscillospiraceae bacterium]